MFILRQDLHLATARATVLHLHILYMQMPQNAWNVCADSTLISNIKFYSPGKRAEPSQAELSWAVGKVKQDEKEHKGYWGYCLAWSQKYSADSSIFSCYNTLAIVVVVVAIAADVARKIKSQYAAYNLLPTWQPPAKVSSDSKGWAEQTHAHMHTHIHMSPPISRYRTTTLLYRYNVWHVCVSRLEAGIGATFDCRLLLDTVFRGCMCGHSHGFYHTIFAYLYSMTICLSVRLCTTCTPLQPQQTQVQSDGKCWRCCRHRHKAHKAQRHLKYPPIFTGKLSIQL